MKLSTYIEKLQELLARAGDADVVAVQTHHPTHRYAPDALADDFEPELVSLVRLDEETKKLLANTLWTAEEWETTISVMDGRDVAPKHTLVTAAVVGMRHL